MKVLLDENMPHELRLLLMPMHDVFTVAFMGWKGISNGELLSNAANADLDVVVTLDRGIEYEHNQSQLPCAVIVLASKSNKMNDLRPFIPSLLRALNSLRPCTLVKIG